MNTYTDTHNITILGVIYVKNIRNCFLDNLSLGYKCNTGKGSAQIFTPQCWCEDKMRPCLQSAKLSTLENMQTHV